MTTMTVTAGTRCVSSFSSFSIRTHKLLPSSCFIITDSKKREVFAAGFRDRIVHHLYCDYTRPCYVMKMDIRGCFMHINREKLLEICLKSLDKMSCHKVGTGWRVNQYTARCGTRRRRLPSDSRLRFDKIRVCICTSTGFLPLIKTCLKKAFIALMWEAPVVRILRSSESV